MAGFVRATVVLGAVLMLGGCSERTDQTYSSSDRPLWGGGKSTTVRGSEGERLVLYKPDSVKLERGDAETMKVKLRRKNFSDDVRVSVSQLPEGVEAVDTPRNTTSDSVEFVLRADPNAGLVKNHQALVTVEGPDGIRATESFNVTVRERS